jgi:hypothetical protein
MQATCTCHTRLCRRHRQTGSSNGRTGSGKARSTLQSRWASVLTPTSSTWMHWQMSPRATVPGYRKSRRPRSPQCVSKPDGPPAVRTGKPRRMQARPRTIWTRMGRTSRPARGRSDGVNSLTLAKKWPLLAVTSLSAGRRGAASPRRGRVAGPDGSGGKARRVLVYALVVRGSRAGPGVRGAAPAAVPWGPLPAPSKSAQISMYRSGKGRGFN